MLLEKILHEARPDQNMPNAGVHEGSSEYLDRALQKKN